MIAIGCDHGGFELKTRIIAYLTEKNIAFKDLGTFDKTSVDYPVYADLVTDSVLAGECGMGVLVCTTGVGMSMAANRKKGIRAALCENIKTAEMTRLHNDANVLCLGQSVVDERTALLILDVFLSAPFSGEQKHIRRIGMY